MLNDTEIVLRINRNQYEILKAIGELINLRKGEININKKININAYSVSKISGVSYNTSKKYLNKLKDL